MLDELETDLRAISQTVEELGHEVVTTYDVFNIRKKDLLGFKEEEILSHYHGWQRTMKKVDLVLFEVSYPSSVNVGAGIIGSIEKGKPVICMYKTGRNPVFINEILSSRLIQTEYTTESISDSLEWAIDEAKNQIDRRFTMNISGEIDAYLNRISRDNNTSRSDYIRRLIEKEMKD